MHLPGFGDDSYLQTFTALPPLVWPDSEYLFLMTMPSYISEQEQFYFADPSNHFWRVLSAIYHMPIETNEQKTTLCQANKLAIWSVCKSCQRHLSEQDTMQNIELNDMSQFLLEHASIKTILCVSHDAQRLLEESDWNIIQTVKYVPSPSGADLFYEHLDELVPIYARALNQE
jgi:hypoxanthine-DNA glycosylase